MSEDEVVMHYQQEQVDALQTPEELIAVRLREINAVRKEEDGFVYYEMENPKNFLEWAAAQDFIFHGSSRVIKGNLKPHQANDAVKESGNLSAVYMTRNPMLAEFTALTGGVNVGRRQNSCNMVIENGVVSYRGEQKFGVERMDKVQKQGYIYIFGKAQADREENGELMAFTEVMPLAVVKIDRKDFDYIIEEIANNE